MSEKRRVIAAKYRPCTLPVFSTAVLWLLMDRLQPAGWVWGAVGAAWFVIAAACVYGVFTQEQCDVIFKGDLK